MHPLVPPLATVLLQHKRLHFFPSNTLQLRKLSELKILNQLIAPSHSILSLGRDRDSLGFKLGFFPSPEDAARDLSLALLHAEYVFYI